MSKKYRVLSAHPFLKEGLELDANYFIPDEISTEMNPKPHNVQWVESMASLRPTWFEEIDSRWKPELGERYWVFNSHGDVYDFKWSGNSGEEQMYSMGNCFKTCQEAEQARDKVKALLLSLNQ